MQKLKCSLTTLALLLCFSVPALADPNPGEMNSPPGETSSPPGETSAPPGETSGPPALAIFLGFILGLD